MHRRRQMTPKLPACALHQLTLTALDQDLRRSSRLMTSRANFFCANEAVDRWNWFAVRSCWQLFAQARES
jgi:hypothetical protein